MLSKENTKEQVADNQMDYLELTESVVGAAVASDISFTGNEIVEKAIFFVKTFVREFEEKLSQCYEEVKPGSKMKKAGKFVDECKSILNDSIPPGLWKPVLKKPGEYIGSFAAERHKEKEKKFYAAVLPFKNKQREVLVEAGLEVFQKFEKQFAQIIGICPLFSWKEEVLKLAIDAVSRARNYISNINEVEKFSVDLVTQGVVLGQSKESFPILYSKDQMEDEEFGEASSTSLLYQKVGIKIIEVNTAKYYRLKEDNYGEKYGYRLLFAWESENWEEIKEKYVLSETSEEECLYVLDEKKKEELASSILEEIDGEDPTQKKDMKKVDEKLDTLLVYYKEKDKDTCPFSFNLGQLSKPFIKRKMMLSELTTKLCSESQEVERSRMVLISGEHGIGKSELARSYAYSKESNGSDVWTKTVWIDARTHDTLSDSFCSLAEELEISTENNLLHHNAVRDREIKSIVKNVYKKFQDGKTLFIFDGASDCKKIKKFLPSNFSSLFFGKEKPYVLITSCNKNWEEEIEKMKLDKGFSLEEGMRFTRKALKIQGRSQDECMISFIKLLNYLPLALAQATTHINKTAHTEQKKPNISEYLKQYKEAMKESNPDLLLALGISKELFIPLKDNFNKIEKEGNIIQRLHNVYVAMACFNSNPIDIGEILSQKKSKKDELQALEFNKFSIIKLKESASEVYRKVQKPIRVEERLKNTREETLREIMVLLVNSDVTSVTFIISIWNRVIEYNNLVNEFIGSVYNGSTILHLLTTNDSKEVVKLTLDKVDPSKLSQSINAVDKMGFTPLGYASMKGSLDIVKCLIEKGANLERDLLHLPAIFGQLEVIKYFINNKYFKLDELDGIGNTPLHYAVIYNQLGIIEYLIGKGANVNLQNEEGMRPLHYAAQSGHLDSVKYLVEKKSDVNLQNEEGMIPLHFAAKNGHLDVVEYLVKKGANVNLQNEDGMSPLHFAAENGHLDVVEYLVKKGTNVNLQNEDGMIPLHFAAENGHLDVVECLVKKGANVNLQNEDGMVSLHFAAESGNLDIVKYLVGKVDDINLRDEDGMISLHFAAQNGYLDIIKYLVENGASGLRDKNYMTPLYYAAQNGHLDIVKYLVGKVNDINLQDEDYKGSLHYAAQSGHLDIVKYLVEKVNDINLQDENCMTPLYYAVQNGHLEVVRYLIGKGAKDKNYALQFAAENGHLEVVRYLIESKADVNAKDEDDMIPLHYAAQNGYLDIIKYLIKNGANVDLQNKDGIKPLHFAAQNGYSNIVEFLFSESKKRRLENMSTTSEENTSNIQLFQDNPSDVLMQFEDSDDRIQNDIYNKSEGKVNSQLENSDSQQLVDTRYWCMQ